jgi:hypothetical protein
VNNDDGKPGKFLAEPCREAGGRLRELSERGGVRKARRTAAVARRHAAKWRLASLMRRSKAADAAESQRTGRHSMNEGQPVLADFSNPLGTGYFAR